MPLPADDKLIELSEKMLAMFAKIFGEHPGIRPGPREGRPAQRDLHPDRRGRRAVDRSAFPATLDARRRAFFGLHRRSS
jgi:hypothetical protein